MSSNSKSRRVVSRKEIWIMDPAADQYYKWLTVIAGPVFYNLMMIVTRYFPLYFHPPSFNSFLFIQRVLLVFQSLFQRAPG